MLKGRECQECYWGSQDVAELKGAQLAIDTLRSKSDKIPRGMNYITDCAADSTGAKCGVSTRKSPLGGVPKISMLPK